MNSEILCAFLKKGTIVSKENGNLLIGWGKREWAAAPFSESSPNFYFPDFFLKVGMPWCTHQNWMEISVGDLNMALSELIRNPVDEKLNWKITGLEFFESAFKHIMEKIGKKELAKLVPYLFEKTNTRMHKDRLLNSLEASLINQEKCSGFIYGLWNEEEGFLGISPETLFSFKNDQLKTAACAGTFFSHEKISQKLLLEHDLVVEGIVSSLSSYGTITIKPKKKIQFADITHLLTPIELNLKKMPDFNQLTAMLHPTPALGAFPKEKGISFLEQFQMSSPRDRYGAPAGYLFQEEAFSVVAIRNVQWGSFGMKIGVGCGIVEGSILEEEINELKIKLSTIKKVLRL